MKILLLQRTKELAREKKFLEEKLNVEISIEGKKITIEGNAVDEYEASIVLEAIGFGFSTKVAILLKNPDFAFRQLSIKDITKKKNFLLIRGRLIGTRGKTKETIEEISGCRLMIHDNDNIVGIIGPSEDIEDAITALTSLIKGSKQANVYRYLEKRNRDKKIKNDF